MPTYHPDAEKLLTLVRLAGRPPFQFQTPAEARTAVAASRAVLQRPPQDVASTQDLAIGSIPARLYRGLRATETSPGLLYLHGGGWVVGSLDSHDSLCRRFANLAECRVLAIDYRLAPEHPFPAAVEDSAAALLWLADHAAEHGIDPARLALAGDSAGGTLAAVLALMGQDGAVPATSAQILFYPVTDLAMSAPSYARIADGVPLTADTMRWFVDHYTPDPATRDDWRASPLRADSLAGAPPAFVLTLGQDPLADEGQAYAARLEQAGVRVTALHLSDQIHGILTLDRWIAAGDLALAAATTVLRDAWAA